MIPNGQMSTIVHGGGIPQGIGYNHMMNVEQVEETNPDEDDHMVPGRHHLNHNNLEEADDSLLFEFGGSRNPVMNGVGPADAFEVSAS